MYTGMIINNRYQLINKVENSAVLWRGFDLVCLCDVSIKFFKANYNISREYMLGNLRHNNIRRWFDVDLKNNCLIGEWLVKKNDITVNQIVNHIGAAIECIHEQNFIHADVKPENILFRKEQAILIDGCLFNHVGYRFPPCSGSLYFAAPEMMTEDLTGKSVDVYSLVKTCLYYENCIQPNYGKTLLHAALGCFEIPNMDLLSKDKQNLYSKCLNENPNTRPNIKQFIEEYNNIK